jgi:DNA-binding beta-propeller fold protein YncE
VPGVWRPTALLVLLLLSLASCGAGQTTAPQLPLALVEDVALPGPTGRFDYMSLEPARHLLAVAHLADSTVLGFDTAGRRVAWESHGIGSAHGVRVAPELGRVFASATGSNEVVALDDTTGQSGGRAPTGRFPDGLAYDPTTNAVFVSDMNGGTETVVDARSLASLGTVPVGGDVGNVQYDDAARVMVVAVGRENELVLVDPVGRSVQRRLPLSGCRGAHGVALDPPSHRAFVACEDNAVVLRVDLGSGKVEGTQPTGKTPDVLAFDPGLGRLYVAAESGVVTAYSTRGTSLSLVGRSLVAPGAHTVAVDPTTHLVYLALPDVRGQPVIRVMRPNP